jgi:aspartyl-tRNA(Asn)/glutamyl-tRNA(Gln) amidotransferase subunit C
MDRYSTRALMVEIQDKLLTHIATLARLSLTPEETTGLARDLREILKYAESLGDIDLEGVPPMSHATEGERFRPDEPRHELTRDQALQNAPDEEAGLFRVPQVIGG